MISCLQITEETEEEEKEKWLLHSFAVRQPFETVKKL